MDRKWLIQLKQCSEDEAKNLIARSNNETMKLYIWMEIQMERR